MYYMCPTLVPRPSDRGGKYHEKNGAGQSEQPPSFALSDTTYIRNTCKTVAAFTIPAAFRTARIRYKLYGKMREINISRPLHSPF
ncbi:hypothetical protein HMPREF1199_01100 [Hoylesella oralis CC98A]|nr:hypothetical protein HMPREF1199_01100 [Hoylesella oralis CC98A]